ncbi:LOW QUALITY PROTEIN: apolipoprotein A-I-like [Cebidichthys violaceus]|uniref:LOW QUALITY PROTEIN: apolipoprotein A-I-like n=1 Tax=Cebidichthys violaceus TaxID=271503 RepID=UPI0035CB078F
MDSSLTQHYKKSAHAEVVQSHLELHQTTIMKFVALALALLLAVASQAATLQADAPSQLAHVRSVMNMYLDQMKESAIRSLEQLDEAEHKELKARLSSRIEDMYTQIKALQAAASPVTDSVVTTIADATADFRASVNADLELLKTELEPKHAALKEVVDRHIEQYRTVLEPLITEYSAKHTADMEVLKGKMEPIVEDLRNKVATNVEETKAALIPIVEAVRAKLSERLEQLKAMVSPYVEEYKDQMKQAYDQAQGVKPEDITALKEKIAPLAEDIKVKLTAIFEQVAAAIQKH